MPQATTVFVSYEVENDGLIFAKFDKQIIGENGEVMMREPHRVMVPPGVGLNFVMLLVDADLKRMGFAGVPDGAKERLRVVVEREHTPERVAKFKAERERAKPKSGGGPGEENK